jgi:hypothetical protein
MGRVGHWKVERTAQETIFTLDTPDNWWLYAGAAG